MQKVKYKRPFYFHGRFHELGIGRKRHYFFLDGQEIQIGRKDGRRFKRFRTIREVPIVLDGRDLVLVIDITKDKEQRADLLEQGQSIITNEYQNKEKRKRAVRTIHKRISACLLMLLISTGTISVSANEPKTTEIQAPAQTEVSTQASISTEATLTEQTKVNVHQKKEQSKKKENSKKKSKEPKTKKRTQPSKLKKLKKTKKKEQKIQVKIRPQISKSYTEESLKMKRNKEYIGHYIYFNQGDAAWNQNGYGIHAAGCGPTSMAVCVTNLTKKWVTPVDTTKWAYENGYYSSEGSVHSAIPAMAAHWDLGCEGLGTTEQAIKKSLKKGRPVIALMGPGYFTSGGHFMVLIDIDQNDNVTIADVGSRRRSHYKYPLRDVIGQSKKADAGGPFWSVYLKKSVRVTKHKKGKKQKEVQDGFEKIIQEFYAGIEEGKILIGHKRMAGEKLTGSGKFLKNQVLSLAAKLGDGKIKSIANTYSFESMPIGDEKGLLSSPCGFNLNKYLERTY